jgi:hypothetical protein
MYERIVNIMDKTIKMHYALDTKVNYSMSIPAMSCEWNGQVCKGWGIIKGYEKANGVMMYVVAEYGDLNNVRLYFESELTEVT